MNKIFLAIGIAIIALLVVSSSLFIVDQRQVAVVKTFGEIKSVITEPGLNFNWPLVQTVSMLDKRIQTLDNPTPGPIFTAEKKSLVIDWLVKWRINDARQFIRNNSGEQRNLEIRLAAVTQATFNEEITKHTVRGVLSDERAQIMKNVKDRLEVESKSFGIDIIDVRIKRVDFVPEVTTSVYNRMKAERAQVANLARSEGGAIKEKISADADKQVAVILSEAQLDAQKTKGDADAQATQIYGEAFGRDPKFAQFYRNLEAYRASFNKKSDVVVVDSSSDFFKAMRGSGTGAGGAADAAAAKKH